MEIWNNNNTKPLHTWEFSLAVKLDSRFTIRANNDEVSYERNGKNYRD